MADKKAQFITERQVKLETKRSPWEDIWEDIADNFIPVREDIRQTDQSGERQGSEIYDGTGSNALNILVRGLYGNMVSPAFNWFRMMFRQEVLNELPEVKRWMQETEEHLYSVFTSTNFYAEIENFLRDGAGFGTATMYIDEDLAKGELMFMTIHPGQVYLEQDFFGQTDTLHRKIRNIQARQLLHFFGDETPEAVKNSMKSAPFGEWELIHAVYPREEFDLAKIDVANKPFESQWLLKGSSVNTQSRTDVQSVGAEGTILRSSGFDDFPYIVWTWEKSGNEEYGRCPGMYALADCMGLNLMGRTMLELAEAASNPPMAINESMDGNYNLMPRGINFVTGPDEVPVPIDVGGAGYPIGIDQMDRKEAAIKEHFNVDFFLFLSSQDRSGLTATEVIERQGEKAAMLGPAIGRLSKALDNIITKVFDLEFRAGRIAPPPDVVFEVIGGEEFDIIYMGPLAQAQRQLFQAQGIDRGFEKILPIAQVNPGILDIINFEEATREQLDSVG
ncbi:MAG: portal protein, partial [Candidatus Thorarchaeota archaeon]